MTRVIEFLIAFVIVVVLFFVVAVFLPSRRHVEHSMETNHPVRQVYDTVNSFKRFRDWHPLRMHDPAIVYTTSGPERGVGAKLDYVSKRKPVGSGSWEIVNSEQDSQIEMAMQNEAYGINKTSLFTLEEQDKTVNITWEYDVEYGWDLMGRYAGLYVGRNVGDDIKLGLGNLVGLLATMPNFDYKTLEIAYTPVQPQNILYVSTSSERNITAVENAMLLALKDIRTTIGSNGLEPAGAPRLITTNFGSDKYEFDVAIPVRRPLPVDPATAAPAAEGTDPAASGMADPPLDTTATTTPAAPLDMTIQPPPPPIEGLTLPTNVLAGVSYAGRALVADYSGHPASLPLVRDMLRSYAAAYGETVHDRAFEEYLTEITETAPEDAVFKVYWPVQ
jgi:hypothetical protein